MFKEWHFIMFTLINDGYPRYIITLHKTDWDGKMQYANKSEDTCILEILLYISPPFENSSKLKWNSIYPSDNLRSCLWNLLFKRFKRQSKLLMRFHFPFSLFVKVYIFSGIYIPNHNETILDGPKTAIWTHQGTEKYSWK